MEPNVTPKEYCRNISGSGIIVDITVNVAMNKGKRGILHRHSWVEIERIGNVVTSRCECGKSRTRIA